MNSFIFFSSEPNMSSALSFCKQILSPSLPYPSYEGELSPEDDLALRMNRVILMLLAMDEDWQASNMSASTIEEQREFLKMFTVDALSPVWADLLHAVAKFVGKTEFAALTFSREMIERDPVYAVNKRFARMFGLSVPGADAQIEEVLRWQDERNSVLISIGSYLMTAQLLMKMFKCDMPDNTRQFSFVVKGRGAIMVRRVLRTNIRRFSARDRFIVRLYSTGLKLPQATSSEMRKFFEKIASKSQDTPAGNEG